MKKLAMGAAFAVSASHGGTSTDVSISAAQFDSAGNFAHTPGAAVAGGTSFAAQGARYKITNVPLNYNSCMNEQVELVITPTAANTNIAFMYAVTDVDPFVREEEGNITPAPGDMEYSSILVARNLGNITGWKTFTIKSGSDYRWAPAGLKLTGDAPAKHVVVKSFDGSAITVLNCYLVKTS